MDWSKVDAALAGALADADDLAERRLEVFVHLDTAQADGSLLAELDTYGAPSSAVYTGTFSVAGVEQLTDQPWVIKVQLCGPLRLLGES